MSIKNLLTITASLGLILISAPANYAQPVNLEQPDPFNSNEKNPLYGDGIDPMQLIHNSNLLNGRSGADFMVDSEDNLDKAAQEFKQQQLLRMQQQQELESSPNSIESN
jgi:hypothetical protein